MKMDKVRLKESSCHVLTQTKINVSVNRVILISRPNNEKGKSYNLKEVFMNF